MDILQKFKKLSQALIENQDVYDHEMVLGNITVYMELIEPYRGDVGLGFAEYKIDDDVVLMYSEWYGVDPEPEMTIFMFDERRLQQLYDIISQHHSKCLRTP